MYGYPTTLFPTENKLDDDGLPTMQIKVASTICSISGSDIYSAMARKRMSLAC